MSEEMFEKARRHESARDMWLGLCQLFDTFSEDRIFDLYNKFFESKWLSDDDTITFVTRISDAWNQLKGEIDKQPAHNKDILLICKILKSLPDKFKPFTAGWRLINEENRSLDNLTQKLCTFESNLGDSCSEGVLIAKGTKFEFNRPDRSKNFNKSSLIYNYCDKKGHTIKKCRFWLADGKPPRPAKTKFAQNSSSEGATLLTITSEVFASSLMVRLGLWTTERHIIYAIKENVSQVLNHLRMTMSLLLLMALKSRRLVRDLF